VPRCATHRPAARKILRGKLDEPQTHAPVGRLPAARPAGDTIHTGTVFSNTLPSFSRACRGTARIETGAETGQHRGGASRLDTAGQLTSLLAIDSLGLTDRRVLQPDVEDR
jgi:hypothetical protein